MNIINKITYWLSPLRTAKSFFLQLLLLKPLLPRFSVSLVLLWLVWGLGLIAIWTWGPHWVWGEHQPLALQSNRVVATLLLLLIGLSVVSFYLYQQAKKALPGQAPVEKKPYQASVDYQEQYLNEWMQHYSQRSHHKNANYNRPWYMLLGDSISGKSAIIRQSDQVIPLDYEVSI